MLDVKQPVALAKIIVLLVYLLILHRKKVTKYLCFKYFCGTFTFLTRIKKIFL